MKILEVNKLYAPEIGGIEAIAQQVAEGLVGRTDISVLVCNTGMKTEVDEINGVSIRRSGSIGKLSSMPLSLRFLFHFRKLCRGADVVQLHAPFPLADLAVFLSGYKGKVVLWWHSDVVRQKKLLKLYAPLLRWLLKRADRVVVATQGHIEGSAFLPQFREKCVAIPYGLRGKVWRDATVRLQDVSARGGGEATRFLFIGRLVYYKGCEVLLRAFAATREKNTELSLVGTGPLQDGLEAQARELGLSDRVHFLGSVSDEEMFGQIADSDVFVLPSVEVSEAFGLVQLEAMAYGKPVINTSLKSGVPYVSLHEQTGLTVPPGDVMALAEAMDTLAGDSELRRQYGENARKRVGASFREEGMMGQLYSLYQSLLQNNQKA